MRQPEPNIKLLHSNFVQITNPLLSFLKELPKEFTAEANIPSFQWSLGKIELSPSVEPFIDWWRNDPSRFYDYEKLNLRCISTCVDQVRARFLYLIIHRCTDILRRKTLRGFIRFQVARTVKESSFIDDSVENIDERLTEWISRGRRYHDVAEDLGGPGALILLSLDIDYL